MAREDWATYVRRITRGSSAEDIAAATGIHVTTLYRWQRNPKQKSPEQVIMFARGMRRSPVEALIAAGYLERDEVADVAEVVRSTSDLADDELVAELTRRLSERHRDT